MNNPIVPIFYACDEAFIKYTVVSIRSLLDNASQDHHYNIYVLHCGISEAEQKKVTELSTPWATIEFTDVTEWLSNLRSHLPIRDYYSKTTYYRLFIAEMFPQYGKAVYIDSDTVVQGDVSELYAFDLGDCYVGACREQAMVQTDNYGTYVEQVVGVSRYNYFNAGVLLINSALFREKEILKKFTERLSEYRFVVTQDEDYLNLICKDHVLWLDQRWNTEVYGEIPYPIEEANVVHYIMVSKPWHYADCRFGDIFWKYAKETSVYEEILNVLNAYTDEERRRDEQVMDNLLALAKTEYEREDNYQKQLNSTVRAEDRVRILEKIAKFEREGRFVEDVEDDPPTRVLLPEDIEYGKKGIKQKVKTKLAFTVARRFVNGLIEDKKLIIKDILGIENFNSLNSGAVVTCNHFNAFDSFAMQLVYEKSDQTDREFYRVIREGNYTSFPGFYGFLMRHCNTIPLSSNVITMKKFVRFVDEMLTDGNFVLMYPEQSMWWNYRKPKPLQPGAFSFAFRNRVPVLPCFITMKDSDIMGEDGFPVQEYTIHVEKPIVPDTSLSYRAGIQDMLDRNYALWKEIYEREYNMPLIYDSPASEAETAN